MRRPSSKPRSDEPCLLEHPDEDARVRSGAAAASWSGSTAPAESRTARYTARSSEGDGTSDTANRRSAAASLGLARRRVSLGAPSRPARPTIWTYSSSDPG